MSTTDWESIRADDFAFPPGGSVDEHVVPDRLRPLGDLMGDLGRRPDVAARRLLALATARMLAPTESVWRDQEHDPLAHAIGKVLTRPGLSEEDAVAWLEPLAEQLSEVGPAAVPAHISHTLHTLRMLYLLVSRGIRLGPEVVDVPHRDLVLDRIVATLHPATPWMW